MSKRTYNVNFYQQRRASTFPAAHAILSLVKDHGHFSSVVDLGCGTGTWLVAARELGATVVRGYEGHWLLPEWQDEPPMDIRRVSLSEHFDHVGNFDLAISLEVAEHLPASQAEFFVKRLCEAAPTVLFAAAIPGQGGDGHVNEQWPDYWVRRFGQHRYAPLDIIRPMIWGREDIPYWYRQNTLLFSREAQPVIAGPLNVVHPQQLLALRQRAETLSIPDLSRGLRNWLKRRVR